MNSANSVDYEKILKKVSSKDYDITVEMLESLDKKFLPYKVIKDMGVVELVNNSEQVVLGKISIKPEPNLRCRACGYEWKTRKTDGLPKYCPRCKRRLVYPDDFYKFKEIADGFKCPHCNEEISFIDLKEE
ncbi:MAG: hypothetical protein BTN85_2029 [Candidatus Methanohalarchaeum thermophilum]|uniref:Uncharacterized protein n=1 Tax=Methanohalarchaeum thermophilum TaxID=1903181 RepID=A0A1Q6DSN5_METT1|nr:MAG: hypothetical protein BTN85_2029 [Candidatus Methanohalarchaeum thermophilum]